MSIRIFLGNNTKLVKNVPYLCEIGILSEIQYHIGKNH